MWGFFACIAPDVNFPLLQLIQLCQKTITSCEKAKMEDAHTYEVKLHRIAEAHQSILENGMGKKNKQK